MHPNKGENLLLPLALLMQKTNSNVVMLHGRWPERINGMLIADIPLCDSNNEGNWMGWTKKTVGSEGV